MLVYMVIFIQMCQYMSYGESCTFFLNISSSRLQCFPVMNDVFTANKRSRMFCFRVCGPGNIRRKIITETSVSTLVWRWSYWPEVCRNFVPTAWVTLKCFNHEFIFSQVRQWSPIRLIKLSRLAWTIRAAKNGGDLRKRSVTRLVKCTLDIFSLKDSRKIPIISLARARYGVPFVRAKSGLIFIIVIAVLCELSCYLWPQYTENM